MQFVTPAERSLTCHSACRTSRAGDPRHHSRLDQPVITLIRPSFNDEPGRTTPTFRVDLDDGLGSQSDVDDFDIKPCTATVYQSLSVNAPMYLADDIHLKLNVIVKT